MSNREDMITIIEGVRYQCEVCIGEACWNTYRDRLSSLLFCNHHMMANKESLKKQGWTIEAL